MKSSACPRLILAVVGCAAFAAAAHAQFLTQDFESFTPPSLGAGWGANVSGSITAVTAVTTADPALVIAGAQSMLVTFSAPASVFDNEVASYYSAVNGGHFTNLAPGTYTVSATFRAVDPGFTAALRFNYLAFNSAWAETTNVATTSSSISSTAGVTTWTSAPITINPGNTNFYAGLQLQITVGGSPITNGRVVIDSVSVTPIPEPSSVALLGGFIALGLVATRRRRNPSSSCIA